MDEKNTEEPKAANVDCYGTDLTPIIELRAIEKAREKKLKRERYERRMQKIERRK